MILIVGHRHDPHVISVANNLVGDGVPFSILDSFDSLSDGLRYTLSERVVLDIEGEKTSLENIRSVWWRQKPRFIIPSDSVSNLYDYYFIHREWNHVIEYLGAELYSAKNINNREASTKANNKIIQLKCAERAGFKIPRTIITNSYNEISNFIETYPEAIFKTFTPYMTPSGYMTYTTAINKEIIESKLLSLKVTPGIFQEYIKKEFELRITVVGNSIFSAKINSNHSEKTELDWRQDIFEDIYSEYEIDNEFSERILSLHGEFGLFYGAYDFIIDDEGCPVFLEVNPSGQWMWLEEKLGFQIGKCIADALSRE